MMKLLFFSTYFYPYTSGITTYPLKIFSYLSKKKFQITVLTFKHNPQLKDREIYHNISIIRMPFLFRLSKGFISWQSFFVFLKYIKKNDLILINIPNAEALALVLLAKLFKKKVICIFHCQVFLPATLFNQIINFLLNIVIKCQLYLSDQIIFYTHDYFNSLKLNNLKDKAFFVYPPLSLSKPDKKYQIQLKQQKKNKIWLGFAGRIAQEKGIEYLIKAITMLAIKNLELVIAGPTGKAVVGEEVYYQKMISLLKNNQINYRLLGTLDNGRLTAFYQYIDILILPSINQTEAFGMVQVESMLAGTAVISSNLPGVRVPIQLTKMGLVVDKENPSAIAKAIKEILANQQKYSNQKLIKKVKQIFNQNKTFQFYQQFLNDSQI